MKILNSLLICLALTFMGPSLSFADHHGDGEEVQMDAPQPEKEISKKAQKKKIVKKSSKKKKRYKKRLAKKKKNKKAKKMVE